MDDNAGLIEAFEALNERKRRAPASLSKLELARWRTMRCQIEEALFQHPRDPAADSRAFLRVPRALRVRYQAAGVWCERFSSVLGEGGLFIDTDDPCQGGDRLALEIVPVGRGPAFRVTAEVAWARTGGPPDKRGMGMRFVDLTPLQLQTIHALVDDTVRQGLLERRRCPRIDTRLAVRVDVGLHTLQQRTHDLCQGGLFVSCREPAQPGEQVGVELQLPGAFPGIKAVCRVIHVSTKRSQHEQGGFGLQLVDFDPEQQALIHSYMCRRVCGEIRHPDDEPRRHARLKRRIKVRFQCSHGFGTTDARDIGGGGLFLQSRDPPPVDSRIDVTLIHPETLQTLSLAGRVVRVVQIDPTVAGQVPGVGVAFDDPGDLKGERFRAFLRELVHTQPASR